MSAYAGALAIQSNVDDVLAELRKVDAAFRPARVLPVVGRAASEATRGHFFARDRTHANKSDFPRSHFWTQAAEATAHKVEGDTVLVSVNKPGVVLQFAGGVVEPQTVKYLTIPVHAEAYGRRAREFDDLEVAFGKGGKPYGLRREAREVRDVRQARQPRGQAGATAKPPPGPLLYLLVKKATIEPDDSVLPTAEDYRAAVQDALDDYLDAVLATSGG